MKSRLEIVGGDGVSGLSGYCSSCPNVRFVPSDKKADRISQEAVGLVFGNNGLVQRHLIRVLKKRAEEAVLDPKQCSLHKFRHTFACKHLRAGVDIKTLSNWLRHSDLATTAIYLKKILGDVAPSEITLRLTGAITFTCETN